MDLPILTPSDLKDVAGASSDRELYDLLVKRTDRLVRFFSSAIEDETWSSSHLEFYALTLRWFTQRYLENRLDASYAHAISQGLQAHFDVLESVLPRSWTILHKRESFSFNPLMLGEMSPFFREIIVRGGLDKQSISVNEGEPLLYTYIQRYIERGEIEDLWKWNEKELKSLIAVTDKWGLISLTEEAEGVLSRYINSDNLIEKLLEAVKHRHRIVMQKCVELFNEIIPGARLAIIPEGLGFEFLDFLDRTLLIFDKLKYLITHLIVGGNLTQEPNFEKVMQQCPKLIGLDISGSESWSPFFMAIPDRIDELNIARCNWLTDKALSELSNYVNQVHVLNLAQNTQLSYLGFGTLKNFPRLKNVDLSSCHQLGDGELRVVLQAAPHIDELSLQGCKRLNDPAFYDLARKLPRLQALDLSRTSITDGALIELGTRCKELQKIRLNHCLGLSDLGLTGFLRIATQLQLLSLQDSLLDDNVISFLREQYPNVNIVS